MPMPLRRHSPRSPYHDAAIRHAPLEMLMPLRRRPL